MKNATNATNATAILANGMAKSIIAQNAPKNANFVSLRGYANSKGKVANYQIHVGSDYQKLLLHDYNLVVNAKIEDLKLLCNRFGKEMVSEQLSKLTNSLMQKVQPKEVKEKMDTSTMRRSKAQAPDEVIAKGYTVKNGKLYLSGRIVSSEILIEGEPSTRKKRTTTLCKEAIQKHLGFSHTSWVRFSLDLEKFDELNFNKVSLKARLIELIGQ